QSSWARRGYYRLCTYCRTETAKGRHATTPHASQPTTAVTAQAPAMVSIASKVGPSRSSHRPTVMNLKLAVSRYDFVTVGPIAGREVLVSFEDQLGSVIDYEDVPHE